MCFVTRLDTVKTEPLRTNVKIFFLKNLVRIGYEIIVCWALALRVTLNLDLICW